MVPVVATGNNLGVQRIGLKPTFWLKWLQTCLVQEVSLRLSGAEFRVKGVAFRV